MLPTQANEWEDHDLESGFPKADFDHMELRMMARLKYRSLALVPKTSYIDDQI